MRVPNHVAIIMDGNGRWAKLRNKPRIFGHFSGIKALEDITSESSKIGVKYLTLFAFSCENWNRPIAETSYIMKLLVTTLSQKNINNMIKNNIKFNWIGFMDKIPTDTLKIIANAVKKTNMCNGLNLTLAINYGGLQDLQQAFDNWVAGANLKENLLTRHLPDVDLLIRTGNEKRISNFLLYEIAYAEIIFETTLWPDYTKEIFTKNIVEYNNRERKFGKIYEH